MKKYILSAFSILSLFALVLVVAASSAFSQGVSQERYGHFLKGINIPSWMWLNRGEVQSLENRYPEQDLQLMKKLGFTNVRVPIDMANVFDAEAPNLLNKSAIAILDAGIKTLLAHDLAIIIDLHSIAQKTGGSNYSGALGSDEKVTANYIRFWGHFAKHLSQFDPERVILEPMNEPVFQKMEEKWAPIQEKVIKTIRENAPKHTIIATNVHWSGLEWFLRLEPLADPNIIYNFHFYEPHIFTHQGATWSSEYVKPLREIPYPSSPEAVAKALENPVNQGAKKQLEQYGKERWYAQKIEGKIAEAAAWAKKNNVKILCDEFGVYNRFCRPDDRAQWIHDLRTAFDKHNIGWAMWTYDGSFGVVKKRNGQSTVDRPIADALGLN